MRGRHHRPIEDHFRHTLRYPVTIVAGLGVPVIMLLLFVGVFGGALGSALGFADYIDYVVPGIILMTVGYGCSSTALAVNKDMTAGIIDRFRTMAIARASVLTGHVVGATVRTLVSIVLVIGISVLMGFRPEAGFAEWLAVIGVLVLFVVALTWMAVAIGLVAKTPEGTSGFTLVVQVLPFVSSAFVSPESMSAPARWFAEHEPFTPQTGKSTGDAETRTPASLCGSSAAMSATRWSWPCWAWAITVTAWASTPLISLARHATRGNRIRSMATHLG